MIKKPKYPKARTRENTKTIAGHFHPDVSKELALMALDQDKTQQALMGKALYYLFKLERRMTTRLKKQLGVDD
jgi:hypothetical protein